MVGACPNCGHENGATAKFCSECGAWLAVTETQGRKVVTILFSDVTGSTSLAEQLDPESLRGVMGRFYDTGVRGRAARWGCREVHGRRADGDLRRPVTFTRTTHSARCARPSTSRSSSRG